MTTAEIIWDRHDNYIIRDIHEKMQEKAQQFMFEKYFLTHRLYAQMKLQEDPKVVEQYPNFVRHILRGEGSVIVVDEHTNEIHAIALAKCMSEEWRSWTALKLCVEPSAFSEILDLKANLIADFITDNPDIPSDSLHLFDFYIEGTLKHDYGFVEKLFNAVYNTARILKMPYVTHVALGKMEQQILLENGYEALHRAIYSIYTTKNRRPFSILREIDEMDAILFIFDVMPFEYYEDMLDRVSEDGDQTKRKSHFPTVSLIRHKSVFSNRSRE